jgi:ubiquinone/menaquinone biosynthesis C-methylase UbiE
MDEPAQLLAADFLLSILGLAIARNWTYDPALATPRRNEMEGLIESQRDPAHHMFIPFEIREVEDGYTQWAPEYDAPGNWVVDAEQPIVEELIHGAPKGRALDAACGTGRHAAHLAAAGYDVVGIDTTEAMLDLARAKLPRIDFRRGRLESLPIDDVSVDLVTCGLALEHVADLDVVMKEFARVLKPGGWLVISDTHPITHQIGMGAFIPTQLETRLDLVRGHRRQVHDYLDAFAGAGLTVTRCLEPELTDEIATHFPSYGFYPEATREALVGLPHLIIWQTVKR